MFITADRRALSTARISTSLSYLTVLRSGTGVTNVSVVFFALKILAAMSTIVQWRGSIGDSWYLYCLRRRTVFQTRNWVIGSPDQWVIWVIFHVRVAGSPGHHFDSVCDPSLSGFEKNAQNAKRTFEMLK